MWGMSDFIANFVAPAMAGAALLQRSAAAYCVSKPHYYHNEHPRLNVGADAPCHQKPDHYQFHRLAGDVHPSAPHRG